MRKILFYFLTPPRVDLSPPRVDVETRMEDGHIEVVFERRINGKESVCYPHLEWTEELLILN
jgi:hypothetical protein